MKNNLIQEFSNDTEKHSIMECFFLISNSYLKSGLKTL